MLLKKRVFLGGVSAQVEFLGFYFCTEGEGVSYCGWRVANFV